MSEIKLKKIKFKSFIKLNVFAGFGMGIIFGVLLFLLSFSDDSNVYVQLGEKTITGLIGGFLALILSPLLYAFVFGFFSIFLYWGFTLFMKFKKTIKLEVEIEE